MKKNFNQYTFWSWKRRFKGVCKQLIIPFCIFQGIRTFIFPTTLDVILLISLVSLALALHYEWI